MIRCVFAADSDVAPVLPVALLLLIGCLLPADLSAAVKVRFYPMGEADAGATVGGVALVTEDIIEPPTEDADGEPVFDSAGDFVPLEALSADQAPVYVLGRDGAGSLALEFDGQDDLLQSPAFDPRDFHTFAALSQGWVKPDPAGNGQDQYIWSLGTDNGGVGITSDGFWQMRAVRSVPDTPSTTPVAFGEWTHVAVMRGGNSANLFINGERVVRRENFWNGPGPVSVGAGDDGSFPFHGVLDDFNIAGFSDFVFDATTDLDFFDQDVVSGVPGDVDQDGDADLDDYLLWSDNVGFDNGQGAGDVTTLLRGDLDQNGRVNYFDFQIINDAATVAGAPLNLAAVPEPSALASLMLGMVLVGWKRRRSRTRVS